MKLKHNRNKLKRIYILRMQCKREGHDPLDKMVTFYRVPNSTPKELFQGHEDFARQDWPEKHNCGHDIKFTRILDKDYSWDIEKGEAVKRNG